MEIRQFRVVIRAKSFERAVKFYGDALALPKLQSWDREEGQGAVFQAGSALLEILGRPAGEDPRLRDERFETEEPHIKTALIFDVPSADRAYEEILYREKNIPGGLQRDAQGRLTFVTHDPDNVRIVFRES